MKWIGNISKMKVEAGSPVQYHLAFGDELVSMNDLLGKNIQLSYQGKINCMNCGRETKKSFAQGYCYPCFTKIPQTEACVLRPELCRAHEGEARDMAYANEHCLQDHFVYLAMSSGLKVGVTRYSQIPTRWIDQGASFAVKLAKTPNRHTAGLIEVALKKNLSDKTNWRAMLKNDMDQSIDLLEQKRMAKKLLPPGLAEHFHDDDEVHAFIYPVEKYATKPISINLDKNPLYNGKLMGIKGQYLIFHDDHVINMRKYGGYELELSVD